MELSGVNTSGVEDDRRSPGHAGVEDERRYSFRVIDLSLLAIRKRGDTYNLKWS
jgi:hypothetical protein